MFVAIETYDRKVALPTPGLPRNRMSTSGIGTDSLSVKTCVAMNKVCAVAAAASLVHPGRDPGGTQNLVSLMREINRRHFKVDIGLGVG